MEQSLQHDHSLEKPDLQLLSPQSRLDNAPTLPSASQPSSDSTFPPKPPSLRAASDSPSSNPMSLSSAPLGQINAARRPGPPPTRASGLTSDIAAKMKAFSLSRQGTPAQNMRSVPGPGHAVSTNNAIPSGAFAPGAVAQGGVQYPDAPTSPPGPLAGGVGGLRLQSAMARPQVPNWNSSPQISGQNSRVICPQPGIGGLAAKRGIKAGGMKLSDATGPPQPPSADGSNASRQPSNDTGSAFSKYSNIIDTQKGTLHFANKAVIHGGGIEFTTGSTFSISLDEVDTMEELGKGNYGTVYKVRHSRPRMRRPGQGLRGNMSSRPSAASISSIASDDSTASAPTTTGTGIIMAMKEIRLELDDAKFAAIIMELDILHRCISPFIVSFYGAFFQEGSVYICLEFMDGGSIDNLYGDGVPEGVLRKITLSTVMGLKCLKDEHNIIHRDVKPTNILVNTKGQVKICDFGVSGNLVASIAKTNIGCQSYMAPERISGGGVAQAGANPGGGTYSVQSDIWSLGLTIIECALGRYPYPPETYNNIFSQLSVCSSPSIYVYLFLLINYV
jgi:mitogen-activated protein kinase kinase